jgi:hypothetical protein
MLMRMLMPIVMLLMLICIVRPAGERIIAQLLYVGERALVLRIKDQQSL